MKPSLNYRAIWRMMSQNTGAHMLDSGGAYGRQFERNQKKGLEAATKEPQATLAYWYRDGELEMDPTLSLLHYIDDRARYLPQRTTAFHKFANSMPDDGWSEVVEAYCKKMGWDCTTTEYTYNRDTYLSQDFVVWVLRTQYSEYIYIIQTHNGCDARGGFSTPLVFEPRSGEEYDIFQGYDRYTLVFDGPTANTSTHLLPGVDPEPTGQLVLDIAASLGVEYVSFAGDELWTRDSVLGVARHDIEHCNSWPAYPDKEEVPEGITEYWREMGGEWHLFIGGRDFGVPAVYASTI